jgi:hypothetical protein
MTDIPGADEPVKLKRDEQVMAPRSSRADTL